MSAPAAERVLRVLQTAAAIAATLDPVNAAQALLDGILLALPHASGGALLLMHPQTGLFWTGAMTGLPAENCDAYFEAELSAEPDSFRRMAATHSPASTLRSRGTNSQIGRALDASGFCDEIRVVCLDGGVAWGGVTLGCRDAEFARADENLLDAIAPVVGRALRDSVLAGLDAVPGQAGARGLLVFERGNVVEAAGIGQQLSETGSDRYRHIPQLRALAAANPRFSTVIGVEDGTWISANGTDMGNDRVAVLLGAVTPADLLGAKVVAVGLTEREVEVTRLVCRGLTEVEIAAELFLSPHTIHDHVRAIRHKLGVRSRAGIASRVFSDAYFDSFMAGSAMAPEQSV